MAAGAEIPSMTSAASRRAVAPMATLAGLAVAYVALALATIWIFDPSTAGSAWWPASGLTFAWLARARTQQWPALAAAVLVADLTADAIQGIPPGAMVFWAAANALEPVVGAAVLWILLRGRRLDLAEPAVLARVLLAGCVPGPVLAAALGAAGNALALHQGYLEVAGRWFVGDALGVLVVAPVVLSGAALRRMSLREMTGIVLPVLAVTCAVFAPRWDVFDQLAFVVMPPLLLVALRRGPAAAALAGLTSALCANVLTAYGFGPFADQGPHSLLVLQLLTAVELATVLVVAAQASALAHSRRAADDEARRARTDPLTRVANRRAVDDALERGARGPAAILLVDLDGFKAVNDTHGHLVGDELLVVIAQRLRSTVRPHDLVARIGGDEFAVLCRGCAEQDARELAARLRAACCEAVVVGGRVLTVTASVGLAWSADGAEDLLAGADRDMYAVKRLQAV